MPETEKQLIEYVDQMDEELSDFKDQTLRLLSLLVKEQAEQRILLERLLEQLNQG